MNTRTITSLTFASLLLAGCNIDPVPSFDESVDPSSSGGATTNVSVSSTDPTMGTLDSTETDPSTTGPDQVCGDGMLGGAEECDDGNTDPGDGCDDACAIEAGWSCMDEPSVCAESCGDGIITTSEGCDDGNMDDGDGCDASCVIEAGFDCMDEPSTCAPICGDGLVVPGEGCDDMNTDDGDGCSATCEPDNGFDCMGEPSVCVSSCGDGLVASDEACDDMNVVPGDGCSDLCEVENGYACMGEPSICASVCGDGIVTFDEECDDMNVMAGDGCDDMCVVEPGFECTGEPSVCFPCDPFTDLRFVELSIGTDYIDLQNTGMCTHDLGGLNVLFDDSSLTDHDFVLPAMDILAGQTLRLHDGGGGDIDVGANIFFSVTRGGAALLCTGVCSVDTDVIDVVAFSEGAPHPPLPPGVTFLPGGLTGITDQFLEVYARNAFAGSSPTFFAADWTIQ